MRCPNCGSDNSTPTCSNCGSYIPSNVFNYAGFWARFFASVIDNIVMLILALISIFFIALIWGIIFPSPYDDSSYALFGLIVIILPFAIYFGYFAWLESSKGQGTLGKMALGLLVIDRDGNRISLGKSVVRQLGKVVSCWLLLGVLLIGFDRQKRGLHDLIANTYVIKKGFYVPPVPPSGTSGYEQQTAVPAAGASQGYQAQTTPGYPSGYQPVPMPPTSASPNLYVNGMIIPLSLGRKIVETEVPGSKSQLDTGIIAEVQGSLDDQNVIGLKNLSQNNWTIFSGGRATLLEPGKTMKAEPGTRIKFGMLIGEIRK